MADKAQIAVPLERIKTWAKINAPGVSFNPPADPALIENFAQKCGLSLPEEFSQYLRIINGETRKSAGMIGNWRLLPILEIQGAWGLLESLHARGAFADLEPQASPYLHSAWWHPGWIPIVSNDDENFICLDCSPPEPTRYGQVVLFMKNRPERPLIAAGLSAWFDRIARDLEAGVYSYDDEEGFNGEALMWSSLESKHLFDQADGQLIASRKIC